GANADPNWRRADVLVEQAQRILPGLRIDNPNRRVGRRPFTPDTRPIIGRSKHVPNLTFATGHGQLGLTLAATTARLVSSIVSNRPANTDLSVYSPDRF
ncbi:MAG: FAD-binding oxidoreductase, partial [Pseudomonadota bacterium]